MSSVRLQWRQVGWRSRVIGVLADGPSGASCHLQRTVHLFHTTVTVTEK